MCLFVRGHPRSLQKHRLKKTHNGIFRVRSVMCFVVSAACRINEHLRTQPPPQSTFGSSPSCQFPTIQRCPCQTEGHLEETRHGIFVKQCDKEKSIPTSAAVETPVYSAWHTDSWSVLSRPLLLQVCLLRSFSYALGEPEGWAKTHVSLMPFI